MAKFEVYEKCNVTKADVTMDSIIELLKKSLSNHYDEDDITTTETGVIVNGNLKSIFERAVTVAEVTVKIDDANKFTYNVSGKASMGGWAIFWSLVWADSFRLPSYWSAFFLGLGPLQIILYIINKDKPQHCFAEAFKAIKFEIE